MVNRKKAGFLYNMNYSLTYKFDKYIVSISEDVIDILHTFCQDSNEKLEAGGILIGYFTEYHIFITKVSTPNCYDKRTRYSFVRDKGAAQAIVDYEFLNNSGSMIYLGEWHTHPEDFPTPSFQDKKMIKEHFSKSKLNEPFILLLIQGIKDIYLGVYSIDGLYKAQKV